METRTGLTSALHAFPDLRSAFIQHCSSQVTVPDAPGALPGLGFQAVTINCRARASASSSVAVSKFSARVTCLIRFGQYTRLRGHRSPPERGETRHREAFAERAARRVSQ